MARILTVTTTKGAAGSLRVLGDPDSALQTDLVLPAVGVTPVAGIWAASTPAASALRW